MTDRRLIDTTRIADERIALRAGRSERPAAMLSDRVLERLRLEGHLPSGAATPPELGRPPREGGSTTGADDDDDAPPARRRLTAARTRWDLRPALLALTGAALGAAASALLLLGAPRPPLPSDTEEATSRVTSEALRSAVPRPLASDADLAAGRTNRGLAAASDGAQTAAAVVPTDAVYCGTDALLIDDLEDGDGHLCRNGGRHGTWFTYRDEGFQFPPINDGATRFQPSVHRAAGARGRYAAHSYGHGHNDFAGLGLTLADQSSYDASRFSGISFRARGAVDGPVQVMLPTSDTMPQDLGGVCRTHCHDYHRALLDVSEEWQLFEVRFSDLRQAGYGARIAFRPDRVLTIQFQLPGGGAPYDLWIDDVAFVP